jgi:hypothetical protein
LFSNMDTCTPLSARSLTRVEWSGESPQEMPKWKPRTGNEMWHKMASITEVETCGWRRGIQFPRQNGCTVSFHFLISTENEISRFLGSSPKRDANSGWGIASDSFPLGKSLMGGRFPLVFVGATRWDFRHPEFQQFMPPLVVNCHQSRRDVITITTDAQKRSVSTESHETSHLSSHPMVWKWSAFIVPSSRMVREVSPNLACLLIFRELEVIADWFGLSNSLFSFRCFFLTFGLPHSRAARETDLFGSVLFSLWFRKLRFLGLEIAVHRWKLSSRPVKCRSWKSSQPGHYYRCVSRSYREQE